MTIKSTFQNNLYMTRLAASKSKLYLVVFLFHILFSYGKDLLLVMAPKYIFDSMQNGNGIKDIVIPVTGYVILYFALYGISHLLTYYKNMLEAKVKLQ